YASPRALHPFPTRRSSDLEIVHDLPNDSATSVGRDSCVEMQRAVLAIRAREDVADVTGKRLRAFRAERWTKSRCFFCTNGAEIFARGNGVATRGTERWIEQTNESAQRIADCERRHTSPSRA